MLRFQGMIFKDKEELDKYINSQIKEVNTKTDNIIDELQKHFNYEIVNIDRREMTIGKEYNILTFMTEKGTEIDQIFFDEDDMEEIKKSLSEKINIINKIVSSVTNMGIYSIKCVYVEESFSERNFHFDFKVHKNSSEIRISFNNTNESVNDFIKNFRQYTTNVLEGEWDINGNWCPNLKIDGVDTEGLLNRAKRVRLEIIEFSEDE